MKTRCRAKIEHLGQTGLRIDLKGLTVLIDPYLSHSVEELDGPDLIRQVPIPYRPNDFDRLEWVLITHEHLDHCDPHTIPTLAKSNPNARFVGPFSVRKKLKEWGIAGDQIIPAGTEA